MLGAAIFSKIWKNFIALLDSALLDPKYTYEILEKSKIGNKSYGASKFSIMGHQYTDVVDVDAICGGGGCV